MKGLLIALLAAGRGTRFGMGSVGGGGKLDADLGGRPLGAWALRSAAALGAPVLAVVGDPPPACMVETSELTLLANPADTQGSSLALAARAAIGRDAGALLVMLADMPFICPETLRQLVAATPRDGAAACGYADGRLGVPACFGAGWLPRLADLTRDAGARQLLADPARVVAVPVAPEALFDIDTEADLIAARQRCLRSNSSTPVKPG